MDIDNLYKYINFKTSPIAKHIDNLQNYMNYKNVVATHIDDLYNCKNYKIIVVATQTGFYITLNYKKVARGGNRLLCTKFTTVMEHDNCNSAT